MDSLLRKPFPVPPPSPDETNDLNDAAVTYAAAGCALHQLFERQAAQTPDAPAVACAGQSLSYGELDRRANVLARQLRARGAGTDQPVGLYVERSLEMVAGLVAILKSGAAYLPIDPAYPSERVAFILADAGCRLLLTQQSLLATAGDVLTMPTLCLDSAAWHGSGAAVDASVQPGHLAYVIYTSGSTGRPKGVAVEHRNIVNYVLGLIDRLQLPPRLHYATVSTLAADLGNSAIFPALASGGCVHVISRECSESADLFADYCRRQPIDVLKIVPSHLAALMSGRHPEAVLPRRHLLLGGEAARLDWVAELLRLAPACTIHNHYGPTETTVGVLTYRVAAPLPQTPTGKLPLGRPLPNSRVYVLDGAGRPLPAGEVGELCIGGAGVARGYLGQPQLTAEKFVADPFSDDGGRLYRSGDRARRLPDGNLEFCGRVDHQVKIHGYRVELGEIEAALLQHAGVSDAVFVASDDAAGDKQLVAYVVAARAAQPLWEAGAVHLLPDGMAVAHLNRSETDYIYREIFELQAYLRHGIRLADGDCVVDAGANIGLFSVFANRLARDLSVYACEPNPAAFACLAANTAAWGTRVKCLPFGLSQQEGAGELTFFSGLSLLSGFYADAANEREVVRNYVLNSTAEAKTEGETKSDVAPAADALGELIDQRLQARTVSARLRTLSAVIADEGIARIDLLKINVEKSELDVLLGIDAADWPKIRQLVVEVDRNANLGPICALLERYGFDFVVEQDPLLKKTELCYVYAVRPESGSDPVSGHHLVRQPPGDAHRRPLPPVPADVLTPAALRRHLQARLPAYMLPSAFVLLDRLPLSANGKVDRQALPAPTTAASLPASQPVQPRTPAEAKLAAIWAELLGVAAVGVDDDFFDLGGHSLLAIKLAARVREAFGVDLKLQTLFARPTVAALAQMFAGDGAANEAANQELGQGSGEASSGVSGEAPPVVPLPRRESTSRGDRGGHGDGSGGSGGGDIRFCELSFGQEQLWFVEQLAAGSPVYHIVDAVDLPGAYDATALGRALDELVHRHEILRTAFVVRNGRPQQAILPALAIDLGECDLSPLPEGERHAAWLRIVHEQSRPPFALDRPPLLRATAVHWSADAHRLLLTVHHIVADEWSMEIIQHELATLYAAFAAGRPSPLPPLTAQYADFARWQRESLTDEVLAQQLAYWRDELADAPVALDLPTDRPRPALPGFAGATEIVELPAALLPRLTALGREARATPFMVLAASYMALLHRYTGQSDLLVGTPITRRGAGPDDSEPLIGDFLNTVVLRARFDEATTFRVLLQEVRERAIGAYAHADLPFNRLVAELAPELAPDRAAGRSPFFQSLFVLHAAGGTSRVATVAGNHELATGTAKFDLSLTLSQSADGRLHGLVEYSSELFDAATIRRLCGHYRQLLMALADDPDCPVSRISLLTDGERRELFASCRLPAAAADSPCLHRLIEAQAAATPARIAVTCADETLTYGELNRRANRLARYLRDCGAAAETLVGVAVERSPALLVALLAVMKAGAAYVPLDPTHPPQRLAGILADAAAPLLLADAASVPTLPLPAGCRRIELADLAEPLSGYADSNLADMSVADNLAYVIFTSGSTGRPKGVAVSQRALVNLLVSMAESPGLHADDTLLAVTTPAFDIAALELFLPLTRGARVVLASRDETLDGRRLIARLEESAATVMQATPATWRLLIECGWPGSPRLKALCGGEALTRELADKLLRRAGEVWNLYGPTETTVWSSAWRVEPGDGPISIGRPIAATQLWVVDRQLQPVPIGVVGELCIGGVGVARGYWRRPELTAEKFVADPYSGVAGARLFRTGDLARRLADGRFECLGRIDQQIKIRGYRIEPGEIESALIRHPAVRAAVVVARSDGGGESDGHSGGNGGNSGGASGEKRLVAYVAAERPPADLAGELHALLRATLPDYMLPAAFVVLPALPLNANGKVDRRALPAPAASLSAAAAADRIEPRTPAEEMVLGLFREVLGRSDFGVSDSFFALGGHSIMAARLVARLQDASSINLPLRHLFDRPTAAGLAATLDRLSWLATAEADSADQAAGAGDLPGSGGREGGNGSGNRRIEIRL